MKVAIIGSGYVGLVTGVCLAEIGNKIIFVDNDEKKINSLKKGEIPIYEPGLERLFKKNKNRIKFSTSIKEAVENSKIIFITVATPPKEDGSPDLSSIENVATEIGKYLTSWKLIVEKSTVPVETGEWVSKTIERTSGGKVNFEVASNPEFLREGSAIKDFLHPDRIVIGVESKKAELLLRQLFKPIKAPVIATNIKTAELIKHASNSFLATKISFINSIANVCEAVGADIKDVSLALGLDKRIGPYFLNAGIGFGGSCFPKDLDTFYWFSNKFGYNFELLKIVKEINQKQRERMIEKVEKELWIVENKTIGILGLSFKPNTDDIRNAPSIDIIKKLKEKKAKIKVYDPKANRNVKMIFGDEIEFYEDPYQVAKNSDCLIILTEWDEFKNLDLRKLKKMMSQPIIIDGRNMFELEKLKRIGFRYIGVGR